MTEQSFLYGHVKLHPDTGTLSVAFPGRGEASPDPWTLIHNRVGNLGSAPRSLSRLRSVASGITWDKLTTRPGLGAGGLCQAVSTREQPGLSCFPLADRIRLRLIYVPNEAAGSMGRAIAS